MARAEQIRFNREPDDVKFKHCIRCGANTMEGLCRKCKGSILITVGRDPCATEGCTRARCSGTNYCKRHMSGSRKRRKS